MMEYTYTTIYYVGSTIWEYIHVNADWRRCYFRRFLFPDCMVSILKGLSAAGFPISVTRNSRETAYRRIRAPTTQGLYIFISHKFPKNLTLTQMPRVNHCQNRGCHKAFYDSFKKPFCPECEAEFLNKATQNPPLIPGDTKCGEIVPQKPSPQSYNPFRPKTWIVKRKI